MVSLVRKYETNNPAELAKYIGVQVYYVNLHHRMNGAYIKVGKTQVVLIEKNLDFNHRQVVLAYELGHIL